jgi:hypothetical protein
MRYHPGSPYTTDLKPRSLLSAMFTYHQIIIRCLMQYSLEESRSLNCLTTKLGSVCYWLKTRFSSFNNGVDKSPINKYRYPTLPTHFAVGALEFMNYIKD